MGFVQINKRNERFIPHLLRVHNSPQKIAQTLNLFPRKFNSHLMTQPWQRKRNPERRRQLKILILTKNVVTGLPAKINDITGSLNYIMSTSFTSIFEGLTEYSNQWLLSFKQEKLNNAEATIKKCRKNTNIFQKF